VLPDWLSATLASDASAGAGVLPPWIHALSPDATLTGRALVAAVSRDDNAALKQVAASVTEPGTILVVAGASESRSAILGDLMAREFLAAGVTGVVTDGLIRDSREVADLGLAVWARGVTPVAPAKLGLGHVGGSISLGGVVAHDGDVVIADADGVVVWPAAAVEDLLSKADARRISDDERLARLTAAGPR
jgi:4-hydroxy-4-methyl-2-oxoglutarate aldolase